MNFVDMSFYSYCLESSLKNVLNVGWLSGQEKLPERKSLPEEVIEKLGSIINSEDPANYRINMTRGIHPCEFCGRRSFELSYIGSCEVLIPEPARNIFFATPSMVYHYIKDHGYEPPKEFVDAVMKINLVKYFNAQEVFDSIINE